MHEIELKLQVPAARRDAVRREVAGRNGARAQRLQAAYFDTAQRGLAEAGLALRLRREGRRWVQTLKGSGEDAVTRLEHEVPRGGAAAMPTIDPAQHAGTPAGARLDRALGDMSGAALACVYRTDIRRTTRRVRTSAGPLELAFDEGRIVAGDQALPVCELEIESLGGSPAAVLAAARRWIERHHLWIDLRSKAERGDLLARGLATAPERKAQPVKLASAMPLAEGRRVVLLSCVDQIVGNASQIASGEFRDEHVHQVRVGLRRLRTALRVFEARGEAAGPAREPAGEPDPLGQAATALFRQLAAARDRAAVAAPLQRELQGALDAIGLSVQAPELPAADAADDPVGALRAAPAQALLLDLLAAVQPTAAQATGADQPSLRAWLARRLNRWHKQVAADAGGFAALDDAARHALRKRAKRLRYTVEFAAALFDARDVRRYLKPLRELQERLGALNDVAVGITGYRGTDDARALFALGWLAARRERLIAECGPALERFAKARRFWK